MFRRALDEAGAKMIAGTEGTEQSSISVLANQTECDSFAGTGSFAVRADESFLLNAHSGSAGTRSLVMLLNWTKELNRLVPMND